MDNKKKVNLFFDLQIIKDKNNEPIYMDFIKQYEEGDVSISKDMYPTLFTSLLKSNAENRSYLCPIIEYISAFDFGAHTITKKYDNNLYNEIINNNMTSIINKAITNLNLLENHVMVYSKELHTVKIEIELEGTTIKSMNCSLFTPDGEIYNILEKVLYFLYLYYNEGYSEEYDKNVTYLLCLTVDNDDKDTANIFNIFTGELNFIFDYKKTEEEKDDPYLENFSENYEDNFIDMITTGVNKTYYENYIDETYRNSKVLN